MASRDPSVISDGLIVLVGGWLFASPWILAYDGHAGWNGAIVAGVIAALAASRALGAPRLAWLRWADWLTAALGLWLVAAPWGGYEKSAAKWNSVIVGLVVVLLATAVELRAPTSQPPASKAKRPV
jgi:SPW repeat